MNLCSYNPKTRNERCVMPVHHGFFVLFQFCEDFIGTHAFGKQLFQNRFCFCFFASSAALASAFAFFASSVATSFSAFFRAIFLLFQISLQSVNVCGDGCDFRCERFLCGLLFCNLRCEISGHSFGLILAAVGVTMM